MTDTLMEGDNLKKYFPITGGVFGRKIGEVKAVEGVSCTLKKGETLGRVGESGCGKSTTVRMLLRLIEPSEGTVKFEDQRLNGLSTAQKRKRRKDMQMVFQDPYASINPGHNVGKII